MPNFLAHRPKWPENPKYLERLEKVYEKYLQRKPYDVIVREYNMENPEDIISESTVKRCIARAKALIAGTYVRNLPHLTEFFAAQREAVITEAWEEIRHIEDDPNMSRANKAKSKALMMEQLNKEFGAVEELLGIRNVQQAVSNESKTLIVISSETAAGRIADMRGLLQKRIPEMAFSQVIDVDSEAVDSE